jgi:zinc protease
MQLMTQVLNNRLLKRLREQLGGTYGVQVQSSRQVTPVSQYVVDISFVSDPSRREELTKATFDVIDSLKKMPPTADELHEVIEPALRSRETARKTNGYWFGILTLDELGRKFSDLIDDSTLQSTTVADIQQAAEKYLNTNQYDQFDLVPETSATPAAAPSGGKTGAPASVAGTR